MSIPAKVYLAGPMTGIPKFNFPAFLEAAGKLREMGHEVVSPAELDMEDVSNTAMQSEDGKLSEDGTTSGHTFGDFLARDVKIVADEVDGVVCLPNWFKSKGARLEVYVALISDKPVYAFDGEKLIYLSFQSCADIVKPTLQHSVQYKEISQ